MDYVRANTKEDLKGASTIAIAKFWSFDVAHTVGVAAIRIRIPIGARSDQEAALRAWFRAEIRKLSAAKDRGDITAEEYGRAMCPLQVVRGRVAMTLTD